jgi:CRISPR-associated protein Cmr1
MIRRLEYQVRFTTPAFLGNAEQAGQWRTPPFEGLPRQWWRVASGITDVMQLRQEEARLFSAANDVAGESRKSRVRPLLKRWDMGALEQSLWRGKEEKRLTHREVSNREGRSQVCDEED